MVGTSQQGSLDDETDRIVAEINRAHQLRLSLHSHLGGFQSGAWLLAGDDDRRAVLKWHAEGSEADVLRLAGAVERLRAAGYPTPAWLAAGSTGSGSVYHVQELSTGEPSTPLTVPKARLLLDVLEQHAGLDPLPTRDRSAAVTVAARDETPGGFRHDVRQLGPVGAALIARYDELLAASGDVQLAGGDLVHGDFNTCNILLDRGRVSAVIDIEDLGSGTRVIDYACLLRESCLESYGDDVELMLREAAVEVAGPGALALCTAATAFFIVGFKRRHQPELLDSTLAGLHRLADDIAALL